MCNNTSNNNKMIDKLEEILTEFSGPASQMCCFAHIINLIAKTIISQFDVSKFKDDTLSNKVMKELKELARDINAEELMMRASESKEDDMDDEDDDNVEGWVDECEEIEEWELEALDGDVQPVQKVLVKVGSKISPMLSNLSANNHHFSSTRSHLQ
jgi:hypothetical protein